MISPIFQAIATNIVALPGFGDLQIAYAEQRSEQGGPRRLCMYPVRGLFKGPNFYTTNPSVPQMVRKRELMCQFECWGKPGETQIQNTDDADNILIALVNTLARSVPGNYVIGPEIWNQQSEAMGYGRCVTIQVTFTIPVPEIVPEVAYATLQTVQLSDEIDS